MKVGVLGTGVVGRMLATKLVSLGHEVTMGAREPTNEAARAWATSSRGSHGTFADAAASGDLVVNATSGVASLAALAATRLEGKVVVDVANPLDFSAGFPPTLTVSNQDSLGEQIQRAHPGCRVVKTLNTVTADVMVEPSRAPNSTMFMAGDDDDAKADVGRLLQAFGWEDVLDLGGIEAARGMEMYLALWVRMLGAVGGRMFNVKVVR